MANHPPTFTPRRPAGVQTMRVLQTVFSVAILIATLFVGCSPKKFSGDLGSLVASFLAPNTDNGVTPPTKEQGVVRIGIVSGHWGNGSDPGAVCPDGTNEHDINLAVASLVRQKLEAHGYLIDLLQEYDSRLDGYTAAVLLSIHSDTCDVIDDQATGFKVAASTYSRDQNLADRLTACLDDRYSAATGLLYQAGSITVDMTDYHAFRAIDPATTAAIIEIGFLNLDRPILKDHPEVVAEGIAAGVLCFVKNESIEPTPASSP